MNGTEPRRAGCLAYGVFILVVALVLGICFFCGGLVVDQWPH